MALCARCAHHRTNERDYLVVSALRAIGKFTAPKRRIVGVYHHGCGARWARIRCGIAGAVGDVTVRQVSVDNQRIATLQWPQHTRGTPMIPAKITIRSTNPKLPPQVVDGFIPYE